MKPRSTREVESKEARKLSEVFTKGVCKRRANNKGEKTRRRRRKRSPKKDSGFFQGKARKQEAQSEERIAGN